MQFSIQKLKELIKEKKITYRELGEMIGVSDKTIQNYLLERTKIDVYTLAKLSSALQVPVEYFFEYDKEDNMNKIYVVQSEVKADNIAIQGGTGNEVKHMVEDAKLKTEVEMLRKENAELKKELDRKNEFIEKQNQQISNLQEMLSKMLDKIGGSVD